MAAQALCMSVRMLHWPMYLDLSPGLPSSLPGRDAIEMAILRLSKSVKLPTLAQSPTVSTTAASVSPTESEESLSASEMPGSPSRTQALPVEFTPSRLDPEYIPRRDGVLRPLYLKIANETGFRPVFASDIDSCMFRGFVRIMVADRPFFDPSGSPRWTPEYYAVYEICRRIYVQKFTQEGHSMLYRMMIRDRGEFAELRIVVQSIIGRPSLYQNRTVRIFGEAIPYSDTGFSPLPPSRPLCARPGWVAHQGVCLCPR